MYEGGYLAYGRNPIEPTPLENHKKPSIPSIFLAETMPTLIRIFKPTAEEFNIILDKYQAQQFTELLPLQVALITELALD